MVASAAGFANCVAEKRHEKPSRNTVVTPFHY